MLLFELFSFLAISACSAGIDGPLFTCSDHLDNPYGICTHVTWKGARYDYDKLEEEFAIASQLGIGNVRADFDCSHITPIGGKIDTIAFDRVASVADKYGIQILGILSRPAYNIHVWDDPDVYTDYLRYVVGRYCRQISSWEVLNEVDRYTDVLDIEEKYFSTLRLSYNHIKQIHPESSVLFTSEFFNFIYL